MSEIEVGKVIDFYSKPVVAGIVLNDTLKAGDTIHITGHTTDLTFAVNSMQIDNANVSEAKAGDGIGIKVPDRVRPGDKVFKVTA